MNGSNSGDLKAAGQSWNHTFVTLTILAIVQVCLYGMVVRLSWEFDFDRPGVERPIVPVLLLLAAATAAYFWAIRVVRRAACDRQLLSLIVGSAIVFRVILLFSVPIQEVDIYRYLWDGAVSNVGVSPFQFSPEQVRLATSRSVIDPDMQRIVRMLEQDAPLREILWRVHFGQLPTIYPPVSQAVFAVSELMVPANSSVAAHVLAMKCWLVGFDIATLFVVGALLQRCRKPLSLCLIYAWCPLLLKEIANSGHLDAIAVFLTTLSIYFTVGLLATRKRGRTSSRALIAQGCGIAVLLAWAVGAKLYPVVLAPIIGAVFIRRWGLVTSLVPAVVFVVVTFHVVWPFLPVRSGATMSHDRAVALAESEVIDLPPPQGADAPSLNDSSLGVTTFLRRWEMNDFLFLLLIENLKPASQLELRNTAWFSVMPDSVRRDVVQRLANWTGMAETEIPFLCTRIATGTVFVVLAAWLAWQTAHAVDASFICEATFLTLAWFWLLCPTQNPWYWTWALPFLPFARARAWLAVSGLVLLYYLRFWFSYHWPHTNVAGTVYHGATFFDFVVTWIEFAPWFVWLAVETMLKQNGQLPTDDRNQYRSATFER